MSANAGYNDQLTSEEAELGYEVREVEHPRKEFAYNPPTVRAVVFTLGPSDRIIKMNHPDGGTTYKHQRYGVFRASPGGREGWLPVGVLTPGNPAEAIRIARAGVDADPPIVPKVPPPLSSAGEE